MRRVHRSNAITRTSAISGSRARADDSGGSCHSILEELSLCRDNAKEALCKQPESVSDRKALACVLNSVLANYSSLLCILLA